MVLDIVVNVHLMVGILDNNSMATGLCWSSQGHDCNAHYDPYLSEIVPASHMTSLLLHCHMVLLEKP